jgi:phosphoribosylformylglycinamidine (FGAM) synthase-like enzyme
MSTKEKLRRMQVLLDESQEKYLARVSKKSGKSVSALIRELVREKMHLAKEARLHQAARELRATYTADEDLTAFTALDSEDWYA